MNIYWKLMVVILLITVNSIIVGCAQKSTEVQSSSEIIHGNTQVTTKTTVLPSQKSGSEKKKVLTLSPNASLRWLKERGYRISRRGTTYEITWDNGSSRYFSSRGGKIQSPVKKIDWDELFTRYETGTTSAYNTQDLRVLRTDPNFVITIDHVGTLRVHFHEQTKEADNSDPILD